MQAVNVSHSSAESTVRVVCISDTHCNFPSLPEGDILIHAGDFCQFGTPAEVAQFNTYLGTLPFKHRIVIAGNHDTAFDSEWFALNVRGNPWFASVSPEDTKALLTNCTYLEDSGTTAEGYFIWGSPWVIAGFKGAFVRPDPRFFAQHYARIPETTDILVTHGPPKGILDECADYSLGSQPLLETVQAIRPKVHVFGHIHEGHGTHATSDTLFVNAAICDGEDKPTNNPVVLELPRKPEN